MSHAAGHGAHDPVGGGVHLLGGVDPHGAPHHHGLRDPPPPPRLAALEEDALRPPESDRGDRHTAGGGEAGGARLAGHGLEVDRDRSLREHADALAGGEGGDGGVEGARGGRAVPRDGDLVCGAQHDTGSSAFEELSFGEEPEPAVAAVGEVPQHERVEVGDMVARQNHWTAHRDVVRTFDRPAQRLAQRHDERVPKGAVDRLHGR